MLSQTNSTIDHVTLAFMPAVRNKSMSRIHSIHAHLPTFNFTKQDLVCNGDRCFCTTTKNPTHRNPRFTHLSILPIFSRSAYWTWMNSHRGSRRTRLPWWSRWPWGTLVWIDQILNQILCGNYKTPVECIKNTLTHISQCTYVYND